MAKEIMHQVPDLIKKNALLNEEEYELLYRESLDHSEDFWSKQAKEYLDWISPWEKGQKEEICYFL